MRFFLTLIFAFSFMFSSNATTCVDQSESIHCSEISSSINFEANDCHSPLESEQKDHLPNSCSCHCHGHHSQTFNAKDDSQLKAFEPYLADVFFPRLSIQKLNGYLSRINRPPIS